MSWNIRENISPNSPLLKYLFRFLPHHLTMIGRSSESHGLWFNFHFLRRWFETMGSRHPCEAASRAPVYEANIREVAHCLQAGAHALSASPENLSSVIQAFISREGRPSFGPIKRLLDTALKYALEQNFMAPIGASCEEGGGNVLQVFRSGDRGELSHIVNSFQCFEAIPLIIGRERSHPNSIIMHNVEDGSVYRRITSPSNNKILTIPRGSLSRNGKWLITQCEGSDQITVYDLHSLERENFTLDLQSMAAVTRVSFCCGSFAAIAGQSGEVQVFNLKTKRRVAHVSARGDISFVCLVTPSYVVFGLANDSTIGKWSLDANAIHEIRTPSSANVAATWAWFNCSTRVAVGYD